MPDSDTTTEISQEAAGQPLFQIKCRFFGAARFKGRFASLRLCVEAAVKAGAKLAGADLVGAKLAGAKLRMTGGAIATLIGPLPIMQIGPLGSRAATLSICRTDAGLAAQTGCFGPAPLADFEAAVTATHGDNQHAQAYRAALALARVAMEAA